MLVRSMKSAPRRRESGRVTRARSKVLMAGVVLSLLIMPAMPAEAAAPVKLKPGNNKVVVSKTRFTEGVASTTFVVPKFRGPAVYLGLQLRTKRNGNAYRARLKIERDGDMLVGFSRTIKGKDKRLTSVRIAGRAKAGHRVNLEASVVGAKHVRLRVRAWMVGQARPGWQKTYSDRSRARIKRSGRVGVWAYLPKAAKKPTKLTYTNLRGVSAAALEAKAAASNPPVVPSGSRVRSSGGKPSASNTGVPAGTKLTRHNGNITVTKNGTVLDKLDIYGFVTIKADNVRITNSRIRGGTATGNVGIVTNYDGKNLVIEDTDIAADNQSVWVDGLKGWNFTARRVHVVGGVDSVKIHGDNVRVQDSLLENTNYFANDPNQGGGATHNDNIQILKGRNLNITGNTIRGAQTHTVLATAQQGDASVVIAGNWLDGGICNVKLQTSNGNYLSARVESNKFGPNRIYQKCKISQQSSGNIGLVQSGNSMENSPSTSVAVLKE